MRQSEGRRLLELVSAAASAVDGQAFPGVLLTRLRGLLTDERETHAAHE